MGELLCGIIATPFWKKRKVRDTKTSTRGSPGTPPMQVLDQGRKKDLGYGNGNTGATMMMITRAAMSFVFRLMLASSERVFHKLFDSLCIAFLTNAIHLVHCIGVEGQNKWMEPLKRSLEQK
jgi:hypothetical protein